MLINCMESFDAIDLEENFHLSTTTGFDVLSVSVCMFPRFANKWVLRFTRYRRAERWDSIRETFQQRSFHSTARCIGCMLTFLCCALFRDVLLNFWEDRLLRSKVKGGEWQEPNNVFFSLILHPSRFMDHQLEVLMWWFIIVLVLGSLMFLLRKHFMWTIFQIWRL